MVEIQEKLNTAVGLHQSGRIDEAVGLYNQVLEQDPDNVNACYLLGVIAYQALKLDKAVDYLKKAILIAPSDYLYKYLAEIYVDKEDVVNAIKCYLKAVELNPNDNELFYNLGVLYHKDNSQNEAVKCYLKAIELNNNHNKAYYNLGQILLQNKNIDEAISCFQRVIELDYQDPEGYFSIAQAYKEQNNFDKALLYYQEVINLNPYYTNAYFFAGYIFEQQNMPEQALKYYQKVIELEPDSSDAHYNMGNILLNTGKIKETVNYFEKAMSLDPDNPLKQYSLGCAYLLTENFSKGWELFEVRIKLFKHHSLKLSSTPKWNGESLKDKVIYLYTVAGFGDSLLFLRYIPLLKDMGAKVLLKTRSGLEELFRQSNLDIEIIEENYPDELIICDYQLPMMSLPYLFKANTDTIPSTEGLLKVNERKHQEYKEKYFNNDCLKVGIAWYTHTSAKRSVNLEHFYPLAQIPNVKVYSLQKDIRVSKGTNIIDIAENFHDFTDTTAAIKNLDVLITIDSALSHVGGILNIPTWVLLPCPSDWRWLLGREDSPWYKSVRLFRQKDFDNWDNVIQDVIKNIMEMSKKCI